MRLEHIGIAVGDIDEAVKTYSRLLESRPYKEERVQSEAVDTHFLWAGGVKIELLAATSEESEIHKFIQNHGEGLHHLAFDVDDLAKAAERLSGAGFKIIGEKPDGFGDAGDHDVVGKKGADGKSIFFIHPNDTHKVLIECCSRSSGGLAPRLSTEISNGEVLVYGRPADHGNTPLLLLTIGVERFEALRPAEIVPRLEPVYPVYHVHLMDEETEIRSLLKIDILSGLKGIGFNLLTLGISSFELGRALANSAEVPILSWLHVDPHRSTPPAPPPTDIPSLFVTTKSPDSVTRWPLAVLPRVAINPLDPSKDALIPLFYSFWDS